MKITEKNRAIKQIQKLYTGIIIAAYKSGCNSSQVRIAINPDFVNNYIIDFDFANDSSLQRKNINDNLTALAIDLRDKIMIIVMDGITEYETGDYGTQPSEYWALEFVKA